MYIYSYFIVNLYISSKYLKCYHVLCYVKNKSEKPNVLTELERERWGGRMREREREGE